MTEFARRIEIALADVARAQRLLAHYRRRLVEVLEAAHDERDSTGRIDVCVELVREGTRAREVGE